jgi:RimJ/RimL family protein N-acetyltransferase
MPPIEKADVRLRLIERADLEMTLGWRNQNREWFLDSSVLSMDQHLAWFEQYLAREDDYVFIIERMPSNEPAGQISLYNIDKQTKKAEYGRLIIGDWSARRQGIAATATKTLIDYAFKNLGVETITLEVLENNFPAIALYRKCGFTLKNATDFTDFTDFKIRGNSIIRGVFSF